MADDILIYISMRKLALNIESTTPIEGRAGSQLIECDSPKAYIVVREG
jgi:hypothetical protein